MLQLPIKIVCVIAFLCMGTTTAQEIALLKYGGGGDWYSNPTSLPNLIAFCNQNINTKINPKPQTVEASDVTIFQYPFVHMTGHGNVYFSPQDVENLRNYLLSGGFIHIDDNYGMRQYLLPELKNFSPKKNSKNSRQTILFIRITTNFPTDCLRYTNTTICLHRHLRSLTKAG